MEERGGLRRWREEDLDEYMEDAEEDGYGYDDYEEEGEEGEEEADEEEEGHKLTQEELDYLKTRERLKEQIRQKHRKQNGFGARGMASSEKKRPSSNNAGFGSFFGPSQPVIARRVIEESNSLRETQHITSKTPSLGSINKPSPVIANGERKIHAPKIVKEVKTKAERLKDMRDYSFLFSDDYDLPSSTGDLSRGTSSSNSTQAPMESKIPPNRPTKPVHAATGLNKTNHVNHHTQARAGLSKLPLESRSKSSIGSVPGHPPVQKIMTNASHDASSKKSPVVANKVSLERKNLAIRPGSFTKKNNQYQAMEIQRLPKAMVPSRQPPSSSKPQQSKQQSNYTSKSSQPCYPSKPQQPSSSSNPQRKSNPSNPLRKSNPSNPQRKSNPSNPQHLGYSSNPHKPGASLNPQQKGTSLKPQQQGHSSKLQPSKLSKSLIKQGPKGNQLKRKPMNKYSDGENEDDEAISMIRQMFRYNPNKYEDEDDDSDMEANFDDIMMEERRSSRIAKREDEEQLRLIEEEERQERMRKLGKKRRLR